MARQTDNALLQCTMVCEPRQPVFRAPKAHELMMLVLHHVPGRPGSAYVVNAVYVRAGERDVDYRSAVFPDLASAEAWIAGKYPHLVRLSRSDDDDPAIVGVWT